MEESAAQKLKEIANRYNVSTERIQSKLHRLRALVPDEITDAVLLKLLNHYSLSVTSSINAYYDNGSNVHNNVNPGNNQNNNQNGDRIDISSSSESSDASENSKNKQIVSKSPIINRNRKRSREAINEQHGKHLQNQKEESNDDDEFKEFEQPPKKKLKLDESGEINGKQKDSSNSNSKQQLEIKGAMGMEDEYVMTMVKRIIVHDEEIRKMIGQKLNATEIESFIANDPEIRELINQKIRIKLSEDPATKELNRIYQQSGNRVILTDHRETPDLMKAYCQYLVEIRHGSGAHMSDITPFKCKADNFPLNQWCTLLPTFLNPPFSQPNLSNWLRQAVEHVKRSGKMVIFLSMSLEGNKYFEEFMNNTPQIKKEKYILTNNIPYKGYTTPPTFKTNIITIERLKPGEAKQQAVPHIYIDLKKWRSLMPNKEYQELYRRSKQVLEMR